MTTTLAGAAHVSRRTAVRTRTARRVSGTVPLGRPVLGGPVATPAVHRVIGRPGGVVSSCRVASPAARHHGLVLKLKVGAIGVLALVGVGVSAAEFVSWSQPDPAVEYVAGHPAWAHVTER